MPEIADRIPILGSIAIDASELDISYIRSPGPGGQNVNKVASAAQLRFDLRGSPSLPGPLKARAATLAGSKLTADGVIVISASRHRTQPLNREDAIARLVALLSEAAVPPKPRRATKPTYGSKQRRVDTKVKRGATKRLRSTKPGEE
jgi:ribosome-associated protein